MSSSRVGNDEIVDFSGSERYRQTALKHLACGVSSTPRASQLPVPIVIAHAEGAVITDIDDNRYVDYTMGYGPLVLGHSPEPVIKAVEAELRKGLRTASVHQGEAELAELLTDSVPCGELASFLSSGTEAVQLALRIARAVTGKLPIVKFRANYHGWFDSVHVANNLGNDGPSTAGQDPHAADSVVVLDWGDIDALHRTLSADFAAVILEPAAINAGCFEAPGGFLAGLRELTQRLGVVLIFDEVITGFRLALGGVQQLSGVTPDIAVLGKAMGAGLPISAVVGTRAAMQPLASGKLSHRGTFNGNPLSVAASIECVKYLRAHQSTLYPRMDAFAAEIKAHIDAEAAAFDVPVCANQVGSALQIFAGTRELATLGELAKADKDLTLRFTSDLLRFGVNTLPRGLMYLSAAHAPDQIAATRRAVTAAMGRFRQRLGEAGAADF